MYVICEVPGDHCAYSNFVVYRYTALIHCHFLEWTSQCRYDSILDLCFWHTCYPSKATVTHLLSIHPDLHSQWFELNNHPHRRPLGSIWKKTTAPMSYFVKYKLLILTQSICPPWQPEHSLSERQSQGQPSVAASVADVKVATTARTKMRRIFFWDVWY